MAARPVLASRLTLRAGAKAAAPATQAAAVSDHRLRLCIKGRSLFRNLAIVPAERSHLKGSIKKLLYHNHQSCRKLS